MSKPKVESVSAERESRARPAPIVDEQPLMSIRAVAERLRLSERQTRRVLADKTVPVNAIVVAGRQRVMRSDLERYLAGQIDVAS